MSELQSNDEVIDQEFDEPEVAEVDDEQPSDLATDSEPQHEENSEEPDDSKFNQEAVNKVINRKHYEAQEAKREAEELRKRLQQFETQQSAPPVVKDYFDYDNDEDYQRAVAERARWEVQQDLARRQQQEAAQRQQQERQQLMQQQLHTYVENGKKAGMSIEEMTQAGQIVESYGVGTDLQQALLQDDDGALIVKHLAANPAEAAALAQMTPYQAALHLERKVRPAAKALKPKSSNAPPPPKRAEGGSVDPELGKYKHLGNAKFE